MRKLYALLLILSISVPLVYAMKTGIINIPSFGNVAVIGSGIGEHYNLDDYLTSTGLTPVQKWAVLLDEISIYHFNTLRLTFDFVDCPVGGGLSPIMNYDSIEPIIAYVYSRGYRVILDLHNWHNLYHYCGSPNWYTNWCNVASRFKGDNRIIGFELFNEPTNTYGSSNPEWYETWHPSITSRADLARAYANLTDQIRAIDKDRTVVWADPMSYFQTTSTTLLPVGSFREDCIFAWHGWMGTASLANDYNGTIAKAVTKVNRMIWWKQQYPTSKQWLGEFGMYSLLNGVQYNYTCQRDYDVTLVNACVDNGWSFNFWFWSNMHWGAGDYKEVMRLSKW